MVKAAGSSVAFEVHGIESIPDADRDASILDFVRVCWGGANSLPTAVLGSLPILYGLSFWQSVSAIVLGVSLGAVILAPMSLFGPLNGTNNAVSSSAHFGILGRIIGSFLSLLTAIAFFSIGVWSAGDAAIGAGVRLFGFAPSEGAYAIAYGLFAVAVLVVCIYGFRVMLLVTKVSVIASSALFILGTVALWPQFHSAYRGAGFQTYSAAFWPAFASATLVGLANPISFGAFLGDWTRYLPRNTNRRSLMSATILAQIMTLGPFLFGVLTSCIIAESTPDRIAHGDYAGGLLLVAPPWLFGPLLLLAVLSGMSAGTTSLYGTGLDFSSVVPRLSRSQATLAIGTFACGLIFVGRFAVPLVDSLTTFVTLIVVTTTPWMVIMMIGYFTRRGHYVVDAMQVFNRGQRGGIYWYDRGWNVPGVVAWVVSSSVALMMVNSPGHFVGVLGRMAGEVDVSLVAALLLPAVIYPAMLCIHPDPRAVFGAAGPRGVPAVDKPTEPITGGHTRRKGSNL
jgi:purine-cytosine permease-like protein